MICEHIETKLEFNKVIVRTRMIQSLTSRNLEFIQSATHIGGYVLDVKTSSMWEPKIDEIHSEYIEYIKKEFKLNQY